VLHRALEIFDELGAGPWSARAATELAGAGDDPGPMHVDDDGLTPDERRVIASAVAGSSVNDIAAATFRSPQSVEHQLATAMRKLGATSREDLRRLFGEAVSEPAPITIALLGTFEVCAGSTVLTPPPGMSSRVVKLVALAGGTLHVDEVAEALWPDAGPGRGRARLRNVLNRHRATSGDVIVRSGEMLTLAPGVEVDVARFRDDVRSVLKGHIADRDAQVRVLRAAVARYRGDLLPDSVYEPWATAPRERLRRDHLLALDRLAELLVEEGDVDGGFAVLDEAIAADPYDEQRYAFAGRLLLAADRRSAAAALVRRARRALQELGLAPSAALLEIERGIHAPRRVGQRG
jgi:DNA-binding SARP family transcriptional activator/DNA-binding CsgD family transcriptional regulator